MKTFWAWLLIAAVPLGGLALLSISRRWDFEWIIGGLYLLLMFMGLIATLIIGMQSIKCRNTATAMGLEYRYSPSTRCLVQVQGGWFPIDQVRIVNGVVEVTS